MPDRPFPPTAGSGSQSQPKCPPKSTGCILKFGVFVSLSSLRRTVAASENFSVAFVMFFLDIECGLIRRHPQGDCPCACAHGGQVTFTSPWPPGTRLVGGV